MLGTTALGLGVAGVGRAVGTAAAAPVLAQTPVVRTSSEAAAVAIDAYVYFYPLVTMNVTRKQATNVAAGTWEPSPDEIVALGTLLDG